MHKSRWMEKTGAGRKGLLTFAVSKAARTSRCLAAKTSGLEADYRLVYFDQGHRLYAHSSD
ncbi:hypothetical protein SBV1_130053 [Verrucomicrobia bacterium]|nr:hypothetical protein SBV1_130053 [Verrucomicrobiota bacterium]